MTHPVCPRRRAALTAVVLAGFVAFALWAAGPAEAGNPLDGRIDFVATLEPADLAPGDSGLLVIEGTLLKDQTFKGKPLEGHHIYADGENAMKYEPLPAQGVTYDMDTVEISDPIEKTDEFGDTNKVWKKHFTLKVKVRLAADASSDTKLGMSFTYSGCTLGKFAGCYPPISDHKASILLKGAAAPKPVVQVPLASADGSGEVQLAIDEKKSEAIVTFVPGFGWHMYGSEDMGGNIHVAVVPVQQEGVTWGAFSLPPADHIDSAYEVRVPFKREATVSKIEVKVTWQACTSGAGGTCAAPHENDVLRAVWPSADGTVEAAEPANTAAPELKEGDILFPVVDDELGETLSGIERRRRDSPILFYVGLLLAGLLLAFTPCVLPIIPITVSVITGGKADIPRKRLTALLATYVLGLSLTFATMGVVAALSGTAMSALFAMPATQWGLVILFLVLAFGMYGVYELQPPAWLMGLQGGAQRRSGSMIGAFLFGCLGAVIASPCTGPAIAALLIMVAKAGSISFGFSTFFCLGLGMGSVFFAVGALNFAMRPGPWMVWVRYFFGIMLVAMSFYYLRNYQLITETVMWVLGGIVCLSVAGGIAWHLHKKEGEALKPARSRGIQVAVLTFVGIALIAWYTRLPDNLLSWTYVKSPEHLQALVADSRAEGKPVVVDFWGDWCTNCKVYDKRIAGDPELRKRFERITRLKVDLSEEKVRWDIRHALGVESSGAPIMVFLDREGRIWRKADLVGLQDSETVVTHIDTVLEESEVKGGK